MQVDERAVFRKRTQNDCQISGIIGLRDSLLVDCMRAEETVDIGR